MSEALARKEVVKPELSDEGVKAFHALREVQYVGYHGTQNMRAAVALSALFSNAPLSEDGREQPNTNMEGYRNPHQCVDTFMECSQDTLSRLNRGMLVDLNHLPTAPYIPHDIGTRAGARKYVEELIDTLKEEVKSAYPKEYDIVYQARGVKPEPEFIR